MVLTYIYRPLIPLPGLSSSEYITNFIDNLDNLSSELSSLNIPSFILSDTNINLHNTVLLLTTSLNSILSLCIAMALYKLFLNLLGSRLTTIH
jgi:hypothetical protein